MKVVVLSGDMRELFQAIIDPEHSVTDVVVRVEEPGDSQIPAGGYYLRGACTDGCLQPIVQVVEGENPVENQGVLFCSAAMGCLGHTWPEFGDPKYKKLLDPAVYGLADDFGPVNWPVFDEAKSFGSFLRGLLGSL